MGTSSRRRLSSRVVEAIADANGTNPREMNPVYEAIDLEALDEMERNSSSEWKVAFNFSENCIVVQSDGTILVDGQLYIR